MPQGPVPRVRDWIVMPLTLPDTLLPRTVTPDEVLMLIPPPSHSDVPEPRPVPKPLPLIVFFSIVPLRLISKRIPSAELPMIWLELITRPSSATSAHIPMPLLALITLPLTVPEDRVDLIPPDSQSAIQKPSVLLELTTLRVTDRRGRAVLAEAELTVVVDQVLVHLGVVGLDQHHADGVVPAHVVRRHLPARPGHQGAGLGCAGEVLDGEAAHDHPGRAGLDRGRRLRHLHRMPGRVAAEVDRVRRIVGVEGAGVDRGEARHPGEVRRRRRRPAPAGSRCSPCCPHTARSSRTPTAGPRAPPRSRRTWPSRSGGWIR